MLSSCSDFSFSAFTPRHLPLHFGFTAFTPRTPRHLPLHFGFSASTPRNPSPSSSSFQFFSFSTSQFLP
jgi:hypothetical protein